MSAFKNFKRILFLWVRKKLSCKLANKEGDALLNIFKKFSASKNFIKIYISLNKSPLLNSKSKSFDKSRKPDVQTI